MNNKLPIVSKKETQTYQIFFAVTMVCFILCTIATEFDPLELFRKSDNFVAFVRDDFFPPRLPPDDAIKNVLMGVVTTVAMAISSTTSGAILAFFVKSFTQSFFFMIDTSILAQNMRHTVSSSKNILNLF